MCKLHKEILSKNARRLTASKSGFTLVELLVVISIIALLLAVLLPALGRVREAANSLACRANIRSITTAWILYAGDNEDRLCCADTSADKKDQWPWAVAEIGTRGTMEEIELGALWSYLRNTKLYKCRSDRTIVVRSYFIARSMNGKHCACQYDNSEGLWRWMTLSQISDPAAKIVVVDNASTTEWVEGSFCPVAHVYIEPFRWTRHEDRNITARHSRGCNISFADGHCEYWKYRDPRTTALANWEMGVWEASEDNPDLPKLINWLVGTGYPGDQHYPYRGPK
jgi:prepilin-type N-terminal cleavage/methylation domain-containing protein/prepilin-type processing-associated H-X9-DG protein